MTIENSNKIRGILCSILKGPALMCASGPLIQTFIGSLGFNSEFNYMHTTVLQAVSTLTIILASNWADRGNIIKRNAIIQLPLAFLYLFYVPFCFLKFGDANAILPFILLSLIGVSQMVITGLDTVCAYKLPYFVYKVEHYGVISSIGGLIGSLINLGITALIAKLSETVEYTKIMLVAFCISFVLVVLAAIVQFFQKSLIDMDAVQLKDKKQKPVPLKTLFMTPVFIRLLPAHLLRGFAAGVLGVLSIVALDLGYDETVTTTMASLQQISSFIGCAVFGVLSVYVRPRALTFFSSFVFLLLPFVITTNKMLFFVLVTVIQFGRMIVDYAVPVAMMKAVPVEIAGGYNAWRMVLHTGGGLIASSVAAFIPTNVLFIMAVVFQLIAAVLFMFDRSTRTEDSIFLSKEERQGVI